MTTHSSGKRPAIIGLGSTSFGVFPGQDAYSLGSAALRQAMADAAVTPRDIDGLIVCRIPDYQRFGEIHGINPRVTLNLYGQGRMSAVALELACQAIARGDASTVALVYGNDGKSAGMKYGGAGDAYGSGGAGLWFPYGMSSPGAVHAMMFRRYEHRHGPAQDALAKIAITFRGHAGRNPNAVLRKPISSADYFASRHIAAPLRLLDYCLINDGGIALIVSSPDRVSAAHHKPVYVAGVSTATQLEGSTMPPPDEWFSSMRQVAYSLHQQTGLLPRDMDALMIYDNFTPTVLFSLDGFGVCERGQSADYVRSNDLSLQGPQPINTNGGHLSESYMQGWGLFAEAVRQIRGTAVDRQIAKARHVQYMNASPISSSAIFSSEAS